MTPGPALSLPGEDTEDGRPIPVGCSWSLGSSELEVLKALESCFGGLAVSRGLLGARSPYLLHAGSSSQRGAWLAGVSEGAHLADGNEPLCVLGNPLDPRVPDGESSSGSGLSAWRLCLVRVVRLTAGGERSLGAHGRPGLGPHCSVPGLRAEAVSAGALGRRWHCRRVTCCFPRVA